MALCIEYTTLMIEYMALFIEYGGKKPFIEYGGQKPFILSEEPCLLPKEPYILSTTHMFLLMSLPEANHI